MLIRAAFISVLLHLVMALSLLRDGGMASRVSLGREAGALNMHLARQSENESSASAIQKTARMNALSPMAAGKSGYSPATVSAKAEKHPALEEAPGETPAVPAEAVGQYRLDVARAARQFKVYPLRARENGWGGSVIVELSLAEGPGNPVVSLGRSSGYDILDRQALDMIEQAARLAVLPPGLRGRKLTLSLPVEYLWTD